MSARSNQASKTGTTGKAVAMKTQDAAALAREASGQRALAGDRFVEAAREEDADRRQELTAEAYEALGKADSLEREAAGLEPQVEVEVEPDGQDPEEEKTAEADRQVEAEDEPETPEVNAEPEAETRDQEQERQEEAEPELDGDEAGQAEKHDKRAWKLPGSVSPDAQQQLQEAQQEGSLMGQLMNYAARSLTERDGNGFNWSKEGASAVLSRFGKEAQSQEPSKAPERGMEAER